MKILNALRDRHSQDADPAGREGGEAKFPIRHYDRLNAKRVNEKLPQHSQIELEAIETYERSHKDRPSVLAKLRYMRTSEPLPDYDTLSPEQISQALAGADAETVRAVRDYERKFGHRREVLKEAARVLPTSQASAREDRIHAEKAARVREGFAGRMTSSDNLAKAKVAG